MLATVIIGAISFIYYYFFINSIDNDFIIDYNFINFNYDLINYNIIDYNDFTRIDRKSFSSSSSSTSSSIVCVGTILA